jgi:putative NADH-flavin reductase
MVVVVLVGHAGRVVSVLKVDAKKNVHRTAVVRNADQMAAEEYVVNVIQRISA